jgi:PRTRC genetic system protein A
MTPLADNPTAAAVLATVPCFPVPPSGSSAPIDGLRMARAGRGLAIGSDGVMLIVRRPWLALDLPIAPPFSAHLPYGSIGRPRADLRCGLIPREHLNTIVRHFIAALPNEAAAFVVWNEGDQAFSVVFPVIDAATPSRLVYRPPVLAQTCHLICDIHSHGAASAFFSATDDADDVHATKIALVFGGLTGPAPTIAMRLCADGMFLPMPRSPRARCRMIATTFRPRWKTAPSMFFSSAAAETEPRC